MVPFSADHCRIGSLEMVKCQVMALFLDHCRIGSLEIRLIQATRN